MKALVLLVVAMLSGCAVQTADGPPVEGCDAAPPPPAPVATVPAKLGIVTVFAPVPAVTPCDVPNANDATWPYAPMADGTEWMFLGDGQAWHYEVEPRTQHMIRRFICEVVNGHVLYQMPEHAELVRDGE